MAIVRLQFRRLGETKPPMMRCIFEQPELQLPMPDPLSTPSHRKGHLLVAQARSSAEAGQWTSALTAYDQVEREYPDWTNDPDFLNDRAVALFHNDRAHDSLVLLDKAINLQPQLVQYLRQGLHDNESMQSSEAQLAKIFNPQGGS